MPRPLKPTSKFSDGLDNLTVEELRSLFFILFDCGKDHETLFGGTLVKNPDGFGGTPLIEKGWIVLGENPMRPRQYSLTRTGKETRDTIKAYLTL